MRRELIEFSASSLIVLVRFKEGKFCVAIIDLFKVGISIDCLESVGCYKVVFLELDLRFLLFRLLDFLACLTAELSSLICLLFGLDGLTLIIYLKVVMFSLATFNILIICLLY